LALANIAKGNMTFCRHLVSFICIWASGFRGEDLKKSANQKQELPDVVAMFSNGS
jgi:hypothetical protein